MSQAVRKPCPRGGVWVPPYLKNIQSWQWVLQAQTPFFLIVKQKKGRLRSNCKAFFTWVGDGVGGLLGGDKAYRKLTLKHHTDKVKRSMKVALKVSISWKMAFDFLEALNVQRACSSLFYCRKMVPGFFGSPERPTGVRKAVSLSGRMAF